MANQIDVRLTPHTNAELASALVNVWRKRLNIKPKRTLAELMLAQILMETADGTKIRNENVGNVVSVQEQEFYVLGPGNPIHFRAFDTLDDGMQAFVQQVTRRKSMVEAGNAGDAQAYVQAIADTNYTPGIDVPSTTLTLQHYVARFRSDKLFDTLPSGSGWLSALMLAAAVGFGIFVKRRFFA